MPSITIVILFNIMSMIAFTINLILNRGSSFQFLLNVWAAWPRTFFFICTWSYRFLSESYSRLWWISRPPQGSHFCMSTASVFSSVPFLCHHWSLSAVELDPSLILMFSFSGRNRDSLLFFRIIVAHVKCFRKLKFQFIYDSNGIYTSIEW